MAENIYEKLREQLDQYSNGFPATPSGVEIRILEKLFTDEEADMFLVMTQLPETAGQTAQRTGREFDSVRTLLDRMVEKGLLFSLNHKGEKVYMAFGFTMGIFEFQLKMIDEELARLHDEYFKEAFYKNFRLAPLQHVTIPVNRVVEVSYPVPTYENSKQIVTAQKLIAVVDCICRVQKGLAGGDCDKPVEVCLMFGRNAEYYIEQGMGRKISVSEALAILDQCEEAGLVTQPYHSQTPGNICNCCSDCCMYLRSIKKHPRPAEVIGANYFAFIDRNACEACETCLGRCQMEALSMSDEGFAQVDADRCIGCGLCATTCPAEAVTLKGKSREERRTPPETPQQLYLELSENRGTSLVPLSFSKSP